MSTNHDDAEPKIMRSNTAMYPGETRTAGNTLIWPQPPTLPDDVKYPGPGFYGQPTIKLPYTTPAMTDAPKPEPDEKDRLIAELREELSEENRRAEIDILSGLRDLEDERYKRYIVQAKYHRLKAQQCDRKADEARRVYNEYSEKLLMAIQDKDTKLTESDRAALCGWSASPWGDEDDDLVNTPANAQDGEK